MKTNDKDRVLLVGNPNVGKSVIFTYLTGRYALASNYPGTTVEVSSGRMEHGHHQTDIGKGPGWRGPEGVTGCERCTGRGRWKGRGHRGPMWRRRGREIIDTPGVNSLFPGSEDEKVTRDILLDNMGCTVVQVADAKNLFRGLLLTTQLAEAGFRVILVLNMMDEARQRNIDIDTDGLSSILGVEVIETVAIEKRGLSKLVSAINSDKAKIPRIKLEYRDRIGNIIRETEDSISGCNRHGLFGALTLIWGDSSLARNWKDGCEEACSKAVRRLEETEAKLPEPLSFHISETHKRYVDGIIEKIAGKTESAVPLRMGSKMERFVFPASIAVLTALLLFIFDRASLSSAGLYPSLPLLFFFSLLVSVAGVERIDRITLHPLFGGLIFLLVMYFVYMLVGVFAAGTVVDALENHLFGRLILPALGRVLGPGFLRDVLIGNYGLISMGLNYAISIVLPIVVMFFLVFGVLEDTGYFPRLTVLTNRVFRVVGVNGKATLPIVLGFGCVTMAVLASRILESRKERVIVVALLALAIPCSAQLGIMMAMISAISKGAVLLIGGIILVEFMVVGYLLGRILKGSTSDFIIELPPLREPKVKNILLKTLARARWFLVEAAPYFMLATFVLFVLDRTGGMKLLYRAAQPVIKGVLGLPVESTAVFIVGFFRRDYGAAGLFKLWQDGMLSGNQIVVSLLVMSLFLPCLATLIVMIKELGLRIAAGIFIFVLVLSIASGGALNFAINFLHLHF